MTLRGKEKYFWERNFNLKNEADIPSAIGGIRGIDSDHDDQFFEYLIGRVKTINRIHLRCTFITNESVKFMGQLQGLKELTIKDHRGITAECLPYINKLSELEYLDISKNEMKAEDVLQLTNLKSLKELYVSSEKTGLELKELQEKLEAGFPGCNVTIY